VSAPVQAWCFSHGRMHTFDDINGAWCTAPWVDLGTPYAAVAEDRKRAHFGDARFMHELSAEAQEAVMQQVEEREEAA
jgi:hypothetical protein